MMAKTTHIGSLPFIKVADAINFNKKFTLPVLSTLPNIDSSEFMIDQISRGITGASVINFKIVIDTLELDADFKLNFLMLKEFKKEFNQKIVKWQIIGPTTLIKSFKDPLSEANIKKLLSWYHSLIETFYKEHASVFGEMILILDEPLFDPKFNPYLIQVIQSLKNSNIQIGIHCCCKVNAHDLLDIELDYLSIDCSFYSHDELILLNSVASHLISGVVDTSSGELIVSMGDVIKKSKYFSPTCGLAFSKIKVCHKALNNLFHL
jgi:methionine synthase II (cobalamin-independent)